MRTLEAEGEEPRNNAVPELGHLNQAHMRLKSKQVELAEDLREPQPSVASDQMEQSSSSGTRTDLKDHEQKEIQSGRKRAEAIRSGELRAAHSYLKSIEAARRRAGQLVDMERMSELEKKRAAAHGRQVAHARQLSSQAAMKSTMMELAEAQKIATSRQTEALAKLEEQVALISRNLQHQNQLSAKKAQQKAELQEQEFTSLLEQGMNPYEVYRTRDMKREETHQKARIARDIGAGRVVITEKLIKEDQKHEKRQKELERERQVQEQYMRNTGRAVVEAKVGAYMKHTTKTGEALLDATGRASVHPSAAVTVVTAGFGMGRCPQEVIDKVARRHPEVGPMASLLPSTSHRALPQGNGCTGLQPSASPLDQNGS